MKGHAIIGFNHGVLGLAENPALGPGFFRQNTSGYALGVLIPKASPSGWVFSQAQHQMIKIYNIVTTVFGIQSIGIVWVGFWIILTSFAFTWVK